MLIGFINQLITGVHHPVLRKNHSSTSGSEKEPYLQQRHGGWSAADDHHFAEGETEERLEIRQAWWRRKKHRDSWIISPHILYIYIRVCVYDIYVCMCIYIYGQSIPHLGTCIYICKSTNDG